MTPAEEDARIKTAAEYGCPERIWLQHDPLNTGEPFDESSETTWCQHRIEDTDAEYVRADLHDEAIRAAVAAERERQSQFESEPLPCVVTVHATRFHKGVKVSTMLDCLKRQIAWNKSDAAAIREGEK